MHRCVPLVLHILVAVFCILCGFYPCLTEIKSFIHSFIHSLVLNQMTALSSCRRFNMTVQLHFSNFLQEPS